jgi:hypothetical protein
MNQHFVGSIYGTFQGCFLPNVGAFGKGVSEEKLIRKSTNQKQELPLTAMFVYRSGRNEQSLNVLYIRCSLRRDPLTNMAVTGNSCF